MSSFNWSPTQSLVGSGAVDSLNSLIGALTIAAGSGIAVSDNGSNQITIAVGNMPALTLTGSTSGVLTVQAAAITTDHTLKMPAAQGAADTYLKNDGSGNLSWAAAGGSGELVNFDGGWNEGAGGAIKLSKVGNTVTMEIDSNNGNLIADWYQTSNAMAARFRPYDELLLPCVVKQAGIYFNGSINVYSSGLILIAKDVNSTAFGADSGWDNIVVSWIVP